MISDRKLEHLLICKNYDVELKIKKLVSKMLN